MEIAGEQRLVIENESESRIQWVIVSALENKKKEKKTSNILADTLDGVVASGNITSGSKGTIDLSGGQYQFYAHCEDGSAIQLKYRLKYIS